MQLMRSILFLTLGLALTLCQFRLGFAQGILRYESDKPVICYYSTENHRDQVPVSDKFKRLRQKTGRVKTANFEVEYINFPSDNLVKNAFQYAIEIWESELISSVPIRIRAEWMPLESGVLGQALWGSAYANFGGEQHMNTFYPVALAEKISRRALNPETEPDIVASFNSNVAWYFGTDGNTPDGKMDMVTIVLHELAHGLGFSDTYEVEGTQGSVGMTDGENAVPFIFDVFVENEANENLLHDFQSPSGPLATALQSTNIFFDSPMPVAALDGIRPELYAPAPYNNGSSISHLDETTFGTPGDANKLMTPQIDFSESIHDPGGVLLGMLGDMGWVNTNIDHEPIKDTERLDGEPYPVTTFIRSDNGFDPSQVKLHYTTDGINFITVNMSPTGLTGQFQSLIPGTTDILTYAYYISVVDGSGRTFTNPGKIQAPGSSPEQGTYFFNIGPDQTSPVITHEPVTHISDNDLELSLAAEVTDNLGVKEVFIEYVIQDGAAQAKIMERLPGSENFMAAIALPDLSIGDAIEYRIVARDLAGVENISQLPNEGYYTVTVTGVMAVQDSYRNDFNESTADFFGNGFSIGTPDGFADGAIHSDHPYHNGTGPDDESHYTYQLQVPIRIGPANPVIKFDEIVLVEPGESGSVFGGAGFYDYVVVEGSIDGGDTWKIFADGYDSRDHSVWLSRYNNKIVNDNSESEGDPALFRERTLNMVENKNFSGGDEVLIRFRLFADQLAHGWGWAIDNLSIQEPVTHVERPLSTTFRLYPVPVQKDFTIEYWNTGEGPVHIRIFDLQGRILYTEQIKALPGNLQKGIDVQHFRDGVYILKVTSQNTSYTRKFFKVGR